MPANPITVKQLRTEYLENPLGIDSKDPNLGWQTISNVRNVTQSAYQVQVAHSPSDLAQGNDLLWDSGKVMSDDTAVQYAGAETQSRQRYFWHVRVWDQDDQPTDWSESAWWEMGLLAEEEWTADWIEIGWDETPTAFKPSPYFRRAFHIDSKVKSARLYITSHGLYKAWLNGERVGDLRLARRGPEHDSRSGGG